MSRWPWLVSSSAGISTCSPVVEAFRKHIQPKAGIHGRSTTSGYQSSSSSTTSWWSSSSFSIIQNQSHQHHHHQILVAHRSKLVAVRVPRIISHANCGESPPRNISPRHCWRACPCQAPKPPLEMLAMSKFVEFFHVFILCLLLVLYFRQTWNVQINIYLVPC